MDDLGSLIHLQELDLKMSELRERAEKIPTQMAQLEQELEDGRALLNEAQSKSEGVHKARRGLEDEVEELREKLSKFKTQLMEVKTNKEYQAVLHEIEIAGREIERKEDQILEQMMASDEAEESVSAAREGFAKREKEILNKREKLEDFATRVSSQIQEIEAERDELAGQIPAELSTQYRKIASARNGMALAEAREQSCQACNVKLRPQLFADIKAGKSIIQCESCSRILYYSEA